MGDYIEDIMESNDMELQMMDMFDFELIYDEHDISDLISSSDVEDAFPN